MDKNLNMGDFNSRTYIDLNQANAINYWTSILNVSAKQLKEAIDKVGNLSEQVMDYLGTELEDKYGDESLYYFESKN